MASSLFKKLYKSLIIWTFLLMALCLGCQVPQARIPEEKPPPPKIQTMVVVGFESAMTQWDEPDVVRSPISGAVFLAEPVPGHVVKKMTATLFERIRKERPYDLVSPGQAKGVYASLVFRDTALKEIEIVKRIGRAFDADAVLIGYLYRWRERVGTDFAINSAASVAFDLYLIRPDDGAILWKGRFDKTQRSLTENILDVDTFLRSRGRWMTVEGLAELGLDDLLEKLHQAEKR